MDGEQVPDLDELELDDEHAALVSAYVAELGEALAALDPWWSKLEAKQPRRALRLRWPAGVASHPRVFAIVRTYAERVSDLAKARRESADAPSFEDDAAWGSEVELPPEALIPPAPRRLLIDRLQLEAPALYTKMVYLVLWPVGEGELPLELAEPPRMGNLAPLGPRFDAARGFEWDARHGVERGIRRLLGAGIDLRPTGDYATAARAEASEAHQLAFDAYERDLERALSAAQDWWAAEVAERLRRGLEADEAVAAVWDAYPVGPFCHVAVLTVVRGYWALCHEINAALVDGAKHVGPELMLLAWLRDGLHTSWIEALTALPYWPVGLDARGSWS